MEEYEKIEQEIANLKDIIPNESFSNTKTDWKTIWGNIKIIGNHFKGARYPTREKHQQSWEQYQSLVDKVKHLQKKEQDNWDKKKNESASFRDTIINQANKARLSSGFSDIIITLATGGANILLDAILGPFDEKKSELQYASQQLKKGWDMLSEYKDDMLNQ